MFFTQAKLQSFLSQVFYKAPSVPWIIPLQGNYRNPQDTDDGPEPRNWLTMAQKVDSHNGVKPDTWIGFLKTDSSPRVAAHYGTDPDGVTTFSRVFVNSQCRLQIVGNQAEQWAETVKHWLQRGDAQTILEEMDAQLYADDLGRIEVSNFAQGGLNTVLAYNVFFKVEWASTIDVANQPLITSAEFTGTLVVQ